MRCAAADGAVLTMSPILRDFLGNALRIRWSLPFARRERAAIRSVCRRTWPIAVVVALPSLLSDMMVL